MEKDATKLGLWNAFSVRLRCVPHAFEIFLCICLLSLYSCPTPTIMESLRINPPAPTTRTGLTMSLQAASSQAIPLDPLGPN